MATAATVKFSDYVATDPSTSQIISATFAASTTEYLVSDDSQNYLPATDSIVIPALTITISESFYTEWEAQDGFVVLVTFTQSINSQELPKAVQIAFEDVTTENVDGVITYTILVPSTGLLPLSDPSFANIVTDATELYPLHISCTIELVDLDDPEPSPEEILGATDILTTLVSKKAVLVPTVASAITSTKFDAISTTSYFPYDSNTHAYTLTLDITYTFGNNGDTSVSLRNDDDILEEDRVVMALKCYFSDDFSKVIELTPAAGQPAHFPRGVDYEDSPVYVFDEVSFAFPATLLSALPNVADIPVIVKCIPHYATLGALANLQDPDERANAFQSIPTTPEQIQLGQKSITIRNPYYYGPTSANVPEVIYVNNGQSTSVEIQISAGVERHSTLSPQTIPFNLFYELGSDIKGKVGVQTTIVPPDSDLIADKKQPYVSYTFTLPALVNKDTPLTDSISDITASFIIMSGEAETADEENAIGLYEADVSLDNVLYLPEVTLNENEIELAPIQWGESVVQTLTATFTKETTDDSIDLSPIIFRFKLSPTGASSSFLYQDFTLPTIPSNNADPTKVEATFQWSFAGVGTTWKTDLLNEEDLAFFAPKPDSSLKESSFINAYKLMTTAKFAVEAIATVEQTPSNKDLYKSDEVTPVVYAVIATDESCEATVPTALVCGAYDGKTTEAELCQVVKVKANGDFQFTEATTPTDCTTYIGLTPQSAGVNCFSGEGKAPVPCSGHGACTEDVCECNSGWETLNNKECFYPSDVEPIVITQFLLTPTKVSASSATLFTTTVTTSVSGLKTYTVAPGSIQTLDLGEEYNFQIVANIADQYYPIETSLKFDIKFAAGSVEYAIGSITLTAAETALAKGNDGLYTFQSTAKLIFPISAAASSSIIPVITVTADGEKTIEYTSTEGAAAGSAQSLLKLATAGYKWDLQTLCRSDWCGGQGVTDSTYQCFKTIGTIEPVIVTGTDADFPKCAVLVPEDKSEAVPPAQEACALDVDSIKTCLNTGTCIVGQFTPGSEEPLSKCQCTRGWRGTYCELADGNSAPVVAVGVAIFASVVAAVLF